MLTILLKAVMALLPAVYAAGPASTTAFPKPMNYQLRPTPIRRGTIDLSFNAWKILKAGHPVQVTVPGIGKVQVRPYTVNQPGSVLIYETSDGMQYYYSAAAQLARLNGMPDVANPNRIFGGPFRAFKQAPKDTGYGNGRLNLKSGSLTWIASDHWRINPLEGGNLTDPVGSDGMWFGTGATYVMSARSTVNAGAWLMFGNGIYSHGAGGGILFHYLLGPVN